MTDFFEIERAAREAADQFKAIVPGDSEGEMALRESLSLSILTLVHCFPAVPESRAPNGCTWSIAGKGGLYVVSIQRPNAHSFAALYLRESSKLSRALRVVDELLSSGSIDEPTASTLRQALSGEGNVDD